MARLRKFCAYRRLERPYTRKSKYRSKSFIRSTPHKRIVRFNMGNVKAEFAHTLDLVSKSDLNIRDNAIESARLSSNRILEKQLGKPNYCYTVRVYPHHVLRENPLAAGAGADRLSTGMKMSFGKTIGIAARVKSGQPLFTVKVNKNNLTTAKAALKRASQKLPMQCGIVVN